MMHDRDPVDAALDELRHAVETLTIAAEHADTGWAVSALVNALDAADEVQVSREVPALNLVEASVAELRAYQHMDLSPTALTPVIELAARRVENLTGWLGDTLTPKEGDRGCRRAPHERERVTVSHLVRRPTLVLVGGWQRR